ncbi:hypothetical protein GCM10007392_30800 [Saccharospirillum salsuginis]|uniref:Uncharacterized protein n=1 Tax=Saccharospirillum salsuginis TaxID=418750 RepID=A0A918KEP5_9GAMM|nr:hypothetical protein GCM10007392_30800 [Saccharospirillum salsuginis]
MLDYACGYQTVGSIRPKKLEIYATNMFVSIRSWPVGLATDAGGAQSGVSEAWMPRPSLHGRIHGDPE